MLNQDEIKEALGRYAADLVTPGSLIGMGTGTTITWLIQELASRVRRGLDLTIVPTSSRTKKMAEENGINCVDLNEVDRFPFTIDGADEVDEQFQLIKGGGGALLQEKMVAAAGERLIIVVDASKVVPTLGKFPLPVEVVPAGWQQVRRKIVQMPCRTVVLRSIGERPFVTDHGHYILDCAFDEIRNPAELNIALHLLPGVVETGLFVNMARTVIVGMPNGEIETRDK